MAHLSQKKIINEFYDPEQYIQWLKPKICVMKPHTLWAAVIIHIGVFRLRQVCSLRCKLLPLLMFNAKIFWRFRWLGITIITPNTNRNVSFDKAQLEGSRIARKLMLIINWIHRAWWWGISWRIWRPQIEEVYH